MRRTAVGWVFALLLVLGSSGCRTTVPLDSSQYLPQVTDPTSAYKGAQLLLETPQNSASNTSLFYYYGERSGAYYGGPALTSYLWYALSKAFGRIGMVVHSDSAPEGVPTMHVVFTSWSDQAFKAQITLTRQGQQLLYKVLDLRFPPPQGDFGALQTQAYGQIDTIVLTLLGDPEFQQALLAAQPAKPAPAPAPTL